MEKDHADMLQQIVKIQAETLELVKIMANLPGPQINTDGPSKQESEEDSDPPCGNPKCLHNCSECVNYYDSKQESELLQARSNLPTVDLIEQFIEYVSSEKVWWLSNISRESIGEQIREFAKVAKPLNDPMGSHEDKLKDFLNFLRDREFNLIVGTNEDVLQEYWRTFQ